MLAMAKQDTGCSRREALRGTVFLMVLAACGKKEEKKELSCTDTSGLSPADVEMRNVTLAYVEKTPDPAKRCDNCQQFKAAPAPGACGGCTILKGPINPAGYCKSWVQKAS